MNKQDKRQLTEEELLELELMKREQLILDADKFRRLVTQDAGWKEFISRIRRNIVRCKMIVDSVNITDAILLDDKNALKRVALAKERMSILEWVIAIPELVIKHEEESVKKWAEKDNRMNDKEEQHV